MRVEAEHRQTRLTAADAAQGVGELAADADDALRLKRRRHADQRLVHRHQGDGDALVVEHHRLLGHAGARRQPFGVAGEGDAGELDRLLVDRAGGHGGEAAVAAAGDGQLDAGAGGGAVGGGDAARFNCSSVETGQGRFDDAGGQRQAEAPGDAL